MTQLIYEGRRYDPGTFMKLATSANIIIALIIVFAWQFTGLFVAEPMSAASEVAISSTGKPDLLETPYVFLWLTPLASSFVGWLAYKLEYKTFGRFVVVYPALLFVGCFVWFNYYFV